MGEKQVAFIMDHHINGPWSFLKTFRLIKVQIPYYGPYTLNHSFLHSHLPPLSFSLLNTSSTFREPFRQPTLTPPTTMKLPSFFSTKPTNLLFLDHCLRRPFPTTLNLLKENKHRIHVLHHKLFLCYYFFLFSTHLCRNHRHTTGTPPPMSFGSPSPLIFFFFALPSIDYF